MPASIFYHATIVDEAGVERAWGRYPELRSLLYQLEGKGVTRADITTKKNGRTTTRALYVLDGGRWKRTRR